MYTDIIVKHQSNTVKKQNNPHAFGR